ncbi:hypothetical protein B0H34DRAFT_681436, partial [Crassisporium funariophilum]
MIPLFFSSSQKPYYASQILDFALQFRHAIYHVQPSFFLSFISILILILSSHSHLHSASILICIASFLMTYKPKHYHYHHDHDHDFNNSTTHLYIYIYAYILFTLLDSLFRFRSCFVPMHSI